MFVGPFIYVVAANVCYTLGWILDTVFYIGTPRVKLYKYGMFFSMFVTSLPGAWTLLAWLITLYTGHKLD